MKQNKLTTSKLVLLVCWLIFIGLIVLSCLGLNVETPVTIVGGILTAVVTGFYMWKSKAENKARISYEMIDRLANKYGIENVVDLIKDVIED